MPFASADIITAWSIYLAGATGNAVILRWIILFIKISFLYLTVFNRYFYGPKKKKESLAEEKKDFLAPCPPVERLNLKRLVLV